MFWVHKITISLRRFFWVPATCVSDLDLILRERRLRWFGHVERSSGAVRTACDIQIEGRQGAGRPKLTWKKLTEKDCAEWKLTIVDPQERSTWRSGLRSSMCAASQTWKGAHCCGWCPCTCTLIKNLIIYYVNKKIIFLLLTDKIMAAFCFLWHYHLLLYSGNAFTSINQ